MPVPSLLAVFAHPDDESLFSGGVLARHAAAGARTAVVTATWTPGTRRGAELAQALRVLGAGEPRMLGYADAKVPLWAAVLAHRSEVERGAAPGLLAGFPAAVRERILATEWYTRHDLLPGGPHQRELTA
ncbi:PIG-L deacetylase family protein [Streptomyces sp. NPDC001920]